MYTVIVADDQSNVRKNVRHMLEDEPDLAVIGETGSGWETILTVNEEKPDVLILDLALGDLSGFEVCKIIKGQSPATKVIMFSIHWDGTYALTSKKAGADGYVPKRTPGDLIKAVREVSLGGQFFPTHIDSPV